MSGTVRLSALIIAGESAGHVWRAVEQMRHYGDDILEPIVLCSAAMPQAVLHRLRDMWTPLGVQCVVIASSGPGAMRNEGIEASTGDVVVFIEPGDVIDAQYLRAAAERMAAENDLAFVTAWARQPGTEGLATLIRPILSLEAGIGDRDPLPHATVFRRSVWREIGGFDASLPSCEWYDFSIRLLVGGYRGDVLEAPFIGYEASRHSAYREALQRDRYAAGLQAVIEKHLALFRRHVVTALYQRERAMQTEAAYYRRLLRQRDHRVGERDSLRVQMEEAFRELKDVNAEWVDWGDLRRVLPVSSDWGYERGLPIDRYYIERFLAAHADDVHGVVLEIQESDYTKRFGDDRVVRSDVIDIDAGNARANLIGDLRRLAAIPSESYDCFILTQTIHVINDMRAVLREAIRILKPGGVLLATLPYASRVCLEYGPDGDFWRVTEAGARELFSGVLPSTHVTIRSYGNVLTNTAFLEGLACEEVSAEEFEFYDPFNPALVSVRAVKPGAASSVARRTTLGTATILLYHRVAETPLDIHGLCVRPDDFRAQMTHIAREYRPMSLPQLANAIREGWLPERTVVVTFDDGYVDNLRIASPILLDLRIPATFFITGASLYGRMEFWWDVLATVFFGASPVPPRLDLSVGPASLSLPTATDTERQQAHWILYHRIRQAQAEERDDWIRAVKNWAGLESVDDSARPMNRTELEDLARRPGHSVGGHGTDHLSYSAHGPDLIRRDIRENRADLEVAIGRIATSFAYPFGDVDERSVQIVDETGYRAAVTCEEALVRLDTDPLRLPRLAVGPAGSPAFAERLRRLFSLPQRSPA